MSELPRIDSAICHGQEKRNNLAFVHMSTVHDTSSILLLRHHYCRPGNLVGIAPELQGWMVPYRILVETRFSARPDRSWGPPILL